MAIKVAPVGKAWTITIELAVCGPLFSTTTVFVILAPVPTELGVLAIERVTSEFPRTDVVVLAVLLERLGSTSIAVTVAELVMVVTLVAVAVIVMVPVELLVTAPRVQVTRPLLLVV